MFLNINHLPFIKGYMNRKKTKPLLCRACVIGTIFCFLTSHVLAQETFSIYRGNDSSYLSSSDRHYTHGIKFIYTFNPSWKWLEDWEKWNKPNEQESATAVGFFGGQNMFTPDYIDKPEKRNAKDMRYSGHLFNGMFIQKATQNDFEQMEINLGIIGPSSYAEDMQKWWHHTTGAPKPIGWEEQIEDEFTFDFSWQHKHKYHGWTTLDKLDSDWIIHYGFTAGTVYRHLNFGATYRIGLKLPGDFGPGRIDNYQDFTRKTAAPQKSTYFFLRGDGLLVDHNRFYDNLSIEPAVGQLQSGFVFLWSQFELGISYAVSTHQFKEQSSFDSFTTVTITYRF